MKEGSPTRRVNILHLMTVYMVRPFFGAWALSLWMFYIDEADVEENHTELALSQDRLED